ncbi:hypothetical protein RRG08_041839 [Elysia crispata]|uniref:Uncharacterized protein n=1 Tax=Elysia crispata TaxID=231223 RepID=A0AAE1CQM4_9GAST|nr:hypothetical protein RRG08_041839 [Elysia crispata]
MLFQSLSSIDPTRSELRGLEDNPSPVSPSAALSRTSRFQVRSLNNEIFKLNFKEGERHFENSLPMRKAKKIAS